MPCSDSSSNIQIQLDENENFLSFNFRKITCSASISTNNIYSDYLKGKTLEEILNMTFEKAITDLSVYVEEEQYILYLEWDALRSALVQYLGIEHESVDFDRCRIGSIDQNEIGTQISLVILPPKDLPTIDPCVSRFKDNLKKIAEEKGKRQSC